MSAFKPWNRRRKCYQHHSSRYAFIMDQEDIKRVIEDSVDEPTEESKEKRESTEELDGGGTIPEKKMKLEEGKNTTPKDSTTADSVSKEESRGMEEGLEEKRAGNTQDSFDNDSYPVRSKEDVQKQEEAVRRHKEEEKKIKMATTIEKITYKLEMIKVDDDSIKNDKILTNRVINERRNRMLRYHRETTAEINNYKKRREMKKGRIYQNYKDYKSLLADLKDLDPATSYPQFSPSPAIVNNVDKNSAILNYELKTKYD